MGHYSVMLKPASSLCDLRCRYCFYCDISNQRSVCSFGIMTQDTMQDVIGNLERSLQPGDYITLAFQGGEPTLAGLDFFKDFLNQTDRWDKRIHVAYALQTNAMHLDENWCRFLKQRKILVGVSYDLLPECHDAVRVDAAGVPTGRRVEESIALLREHGVQFNVLCTLTNQIARHPQQVWKRIVQMDLRHVQFTPCLDELERPGQSVYAITPKRFASFYGALYRYWLVDYRAGRYRSIKLFDDVIGYMAFGVPAACGMGGQCQPQFVIEADGTAYPCDFYCLDHYALGNLREKTLPELFAAAAAKAFLTRPRPQPARCRTCTFERFCGGGCERMQREICCSGEDTFCGYQRFLEENLQSLQQIAALERHSQQRL